MSHYHQAEEAARQREDEEASLYKFKSRSHGDGMTDEQLEEKELRESFPSFEKVIMPGIYTRSDSYEEGHIFEWTGKCYRKGEKKKRGSSKNEMVRGAMITFICNEIHVHGWSNKYIKFYLIVL